MKNLFYNAFDLTQLDAPGPRDPDPEDHRTLFQIDRDRVMFSHPFRRLQSKTQVFQSGKYDFYRTRLTHSIEVARISRSICEFLHTRFNRLLGEQHCIDIDLLEAIGLSHDLGHPPFGHMGERKLNQLMAAYGGFEGNAQTFRILTELIYPRKLRPRGMRPTRAFLDGILKYKTLFSEACLNGTPPENHFIYDDQSQRRAFVIGAIPVGELGTLNHLKSIECQIMDWADDVAYCLHDILDGIKAGFISCSKLEHWAAERTLEDHQRDYLETLLNMIDKDQVEAIFSTKVGTFIRASSLSPCENFMSEQTRRYAYTLNIQPEILEESKFYKKIALDIIFNSHTLQQIEFKSSQILDKLWEAFVNNYMHSDTHRLALLPRPSHDWVENEPTPDGKARRLCDFIANLTDLEAIRLYRKLFEPDFGSISDLT